ncbi:hypothetical protein J5N97_004334 [Dioscorea zingiberensis]|uniref:RING-type E3 ubiquitin transferase n=1 Tax=Dioscorea zingiberensis TaxID=325984 RepID=A0A9D5D6G1_9LILI|nr:hypothetical protein J5N97_004334 [Dioscorea zingiberensis]
MGQRHMHCTYQMPFLEADRGQAHFYRETCISQSNTVDFLNQSMLPASTTAGDNADLDLNQVRNHVGRNMLYGNSHGIVRNHSHAANHVLVGASSNFDNHHPFPSSSSRNFSVFQNDGSADNIPSSGNNRLVGENVGGFGMANYFADSDRRSCKRKNAEVMPGNYSDINRPMSSSVSFSSPYLSLNSAQQPWNGTTHEYCFNFSNSSFVTPSGYMGSGILPTTGRSHRSMWDRSTFASHQLEPAVVHHNNYLVQGNFMGQTFQPANNSLMDQFGSNVGEGRYSNWTNPHSMTHLPGRSLNSTDAEVVNFYVQGHQGNLVCENAVFLPHPAPIPNFHQHLAPVQNLQMQSNGHHMHMPGSSYQLPLHNWYPSSINAPLDALESSYRFLPFPPSAELICRTPLQQLPTAVEVNQRNLRILSPEDASVVELSGFYALGDAIDRHRDMRLDIDNMSYEELLALEEQIGDVGTGLTEQFILKNLKTSIHNQQLSLQSDQSSKFIPENGTCTICQVEFEENERVGSLDCGHKYHADCIRQWLLVKNICPICKTSALASDKSDG